MTIDEIIRRIRAYKQQFGADLFPGADEAELARLAADVQACYGVALPEEYLALLRQVNGLSHDGYTLFASKPMFIRPGEQEYPLVDGIVEANEGFKLDDMDIPDGLAIGEGLMGDVYGIELQGGGLVQYDLYRKPLKRFGSFEEMFREMFERVA